MQENIPDNQYIELLMDYQYAIKQIQSNQVFSRRINITYGVLIVIVFLSQLVFLETPHNHLIYMYGSSLIIMVCGILMFVIDLIIIARFFMSISRINQLMSASWFGTAMRFLFLFLFCLLFLFRAITEDFLKTGTYFSLLWTDRKLDIEISSDPVQKWIFNKNAHIFYDWFAMILGLYVIRVKLAISFDNRERQSFSSALSTEISQMSIKKRISQNSFTKSLLNYQE